MNQYIRICPVCDTENPPDRVHCVSCATLLAGVDFSLPRASAEPVPPAESPGAEAASPAASVSPSPMGGSAALDGSTLAAEAAPPLAWPELPVDDGVSTAGADSSLAAAVPVLCADPDCGQANPPDSVRCRYCNSLLPAPQAMAPAVPDSVRSAPRSAPVPAGVVGNAVDAAVQPDPASATPGLELAPPLLAEGAIPSPVRPASARPLRTNLPEPLAARFRVVDELQASGSEADLLIVEPLTGGEPLVAKLYRRGIRPDSALLARVSAAGPHVVNLLEHGLTDGTAWELMEYCRAGSLRELIRRGLLSQDTLRDLVRELAAGLEEIHAQRILHRDLKPENVLVRRREPLSLALTDFGIASLSEGTRHFTDSARTVKYAAPEALTGIIDPKADWWSVGMMLLEAASGRHPFDGLSEQVINHHLATRPVEVSGVADEAFARLCRGLLLRDPSRRWGAAEVARWLQGDTSLELPRETGAAVLRPYHIGEHEARSGEELAIALASHWQEGLQDLKRGLLGEWLKAELHDFNLTRRLADILEARGESDDRRLLRFLLAAAPQLPPVWQGQPAHREAILAQARLAVAEDEGSEAAAAAARAWLESLYEDGALALFARQGNDALEALDQPWRQGLEQLRETWEAVRAAQRQWANRPRAVTGNEQARVVNFDAVVYGREEGLTFPPRAQWHGPLLLAQNLPAYLDAQQEALQREAALLAEEVPWFARLVGEFVRGEAARRPLLILVAWRLLPVAKALAQEERGQREQVRQGREQAIAELRQEVTVTLAPLLLPWDHTDALSRQELRQLLGQFQIAAARISALTYPEESFALMLRQLSALQRLAFSVEQSLDRADREDAFQQLFLQQNRLGVVAGVVMLIAYSGPVWLSPLAILGLVGFVLWRLQLRRQARRGVQLQVQLLQRQASLFSRPPEKAPAGQARGMFEALAG